MKILTFQARHFGWRPFSKTLPDMPDASGEVRVEECVVAFVHAETRDAESDERRAKVFKKALKHLKWLANKREMTNIVLHSFAHLGGEKAPPDFAHQLFNDLAERLRSTGYTVWITPFGWFHAWDIDVYGESLAKVFKEL